MVNRAFASRLRGAEKMNDANPNAVVHLDAMADIVEFAIESEQLESTLRSLRDF